ncbi:hypothetical protein AMTR_s00003p00122210 [Amborella trichopoda]|uniref:Uncharacterized protein n=1 Tax=Amborella trichopoda TaxID=13333 RepID=W1P876_AMBTC|nr:hypothetical protein AMTR_s00003p00122210 [Amborella trichopoda]
MTQGSETLHKHQISSSCEVDEELTAPAAPHLLSDLLPCVVESRFPRAFGLKRFGIDMGLKV